MDHVDEILSFWIGEIGPDGKVAPQKSARWWKKSDAFDAEIRDRFGALVEKAKSGLLDAWKSSARGSLALVILLDQFGRNIHRGTADAFAGDPKAREVARDALDAGFDRTLQPMEAYFFYMPLMHSEDLADQNRCIELFEAGAAATELAGAKSSLTDGAKFGRKHRAIIERFGRFPHRNAALGRESTPEEAEFLKQPGSSF